MPEDSICLLSLTPTCKDLIDGLNRVNILLGALSTFLTQNLEQIPIW